MRRIKTFSIFLSASADAPVYFIHQIRHDFVGNFHLGTDGGRHVDVTGYDRLGEENVEADIVGGYKHGLHMGWVAILAVAIVG